MENAIAISDSAIARASRRAPLDTSFVLFFLSMDLVRAFEGFLDLGFAISAMTVAAFIALPYFLPFDAERPNFGIWAFGRLNIALVGVLAGWAIQMTSGVVFPESLKYLPMTLLIVSGIFCAFSQMRGIIRVRLAR
jgi:hypothetical protein